MIFVGLKEDIVARTRFYVVSIDMEVPRASRREDRANAIKFVCGYFSYSISRDAVNGIYASARIKVCPLLLGLVTEQDGQFVNCSGGPTSVIFARYLIMVRRGLTVGGMDHVVPIANPVIDVFR